MKLRFVLPGGKSLIPVLKTSSKSHFLKELKVEM